MLVKICVGNRHRIPLALYSMYELITPSFWLQNRNALIQALGPITDRQTEGALSGGQKRKGGPSSLLKPSASLSPLDSISHPCPLHLSCSPGLRPFPFYACLCPSEGLSESLCLKVRNLHLLSFSV